MEALTLGSLFSGVGGFELGAEMCNIETKWCCEIEKKQREILKKRFPHAKIHKDIRDLRDVEYVDIICGGFPCQDLSIANVSNKKLWKNGKVIGINGERSGLWSEMYRILRIAKPKYVFFENSPMLLVRGFERVLCDLSKIGYNAEWTCLSASEAGYNHKRERLYCVAYSGKARRVHNTQILRLLQQLLQEEVSKQNSLSMPFKRFDCKSDFSDVQLDDGFSSELDKSGIEMFGNAVIPSITALFFKCILDFDKNVEYDKN